MNEREYNNVYSNTNSTPANNQYNDSYYADASQQGAGYGSVSQQYRVTGNVQPQTVSQTAPDSVSNDMSAGGRQSSYSYQNYRSQFGSQSESHQAVQDHKQTEKSKSGKGKTTALIACSLALALCLGFGGGILGSAVMGGANGVETAEASSSSKTETKKSSASTSDGKDSGLTIVEASKTEKTVSSIQDVVDNVKDSVVEIVTESSSYSSFYGQYLMQSAGSGVIISEDGYIITNHHVIEDATNVEITLTDGSSYDAEIVGSDETFDIALLKIDATGLTAATFGDSTNLSLGETAIVIGNPLGQLGGTVTTGIVSSLNRVLSIENKEMELIQTDAAINPGNSGGGMFDIEGNLVGIVVAKSTSTSTGTAVEGIGYAIPINNVKSILGDLKSKGYVSGRAALGISVLDVLTDSSKARYNVDKTGVYIYEINSGSAADKAGLKVGDCIEKVGNYEVSKTSDVSSALLKYRAGDKIDIVVYRDGEDVTVSVTLDEVKSESETSNSNNFKYNESDDSRGYDYDDWYDYFG